jgi:hypothetical protein
VEIVANNLQLLGGGNTGSGGGSSSFGSRQDAAAPADTDGDSFTDDIPF